MSDFREQLFPYLAKERFSTFSCDHIVPPEHISTYAVAKGPTGIELKFTFDKRKDLNLVSPLFPDLSTLLIRRLKRRSTNSDAVSLISPNSFPKASSASSLPTTFSTRFKLAGRLRVFSRDCRGRRRCFGNRRRVGRSRGRLRCTLRRTVGRAL
jgi:hypothetical protein